MLYTREFPVQKNESEPGLLRQMDGSPKRGLYAAKTHGFDVEMLFAQPPTIVRAISRADRGDYYLPRKDANVTPIAFDFKTLCASPISHRLMLTLDGVTQTSLVLNPKTAPRSYAWRDMDADHLWFVYEGYGKCFTDFGSFTYRPHDFIFVPRLALSFFEAQGMTRFVGIQTEKELRLASRRPFDNTGIPFAMSAMVLPDSYVGGAGPQVKSVFVQRERQVSHVEYECSPATCVAWEGSPYPFAIAADKLNFAYTQSIHPDPSNFAVFATTDLSAVISVLGPRFMHSLPYAHMNKWDEFLFYVKTYDARKGSKGGVGESGTATLHPSGIWHGPQMAAFEAWKPPASPKDLPWVDDLAIMFETRKPLHLLSNAATGKFLIPGYEKSWFESWEDYEKRHPRSMGGVGSW